MLPNTGPLQVVILIVLLVVFALRLASLNVAGVVFCILFVAAFGLALATMAMFSRRHYAVVLEPHALILERWGRTPRQVAYDDIRSVEFRQVLATRGAPLRIARKHGFDVFVSVANLEDPSAFLNSMDKRLGINIRGKHGR
jgi:hypothetical protein